MTNSSKFIIKIACLAIPFTTLSLVLHDGGNGGGIGGGGYDLSGLVYGMALYIVITVWLIWMFIGYSLGKTATDKKLQLILLAIGLTSLIAAWFITPRMF